MELILQVIVSGILMGAVYSLVSAGLTLIWGVMDIINFAHGEFLMISMYSAFWLYSLLGFDPLVSIPACIIVTFVLGVLTYKLVIRNVINAPGLTALLATFGLSLLLRNLAFYFWSPNSRFINDAIVTDKYIRIPGVSIGLPQVVAGVGSIIMTYMIYVLVANTKTGRAIQATAMDGDTAKLMGINTESIYAITFGVGGACVGIAGALMSTIFPVYPEVGVLFSLLAFVVVALGGFGNIKGAFWGGIIIGLAEALGGFIVGPAYKYAIVFLIYLVVVLVRPKGLFGW